jgi:hypothetical protein
MRHDYRPRRANFFAQNLLWIGYQAWQGYLNFDRGLVVISSEIDLLDDASSDWGDITSPSLNFRYIPQPRLSIYLQEWLVPNQSIDPILAAIGDYQPQTELVFAIESNLKLDIGWCQNLQVLPPDCHAQIRRRLSEFQLT